MQHSERHTTPYHQRYQDTELWSLCATILDLERTFDRVWHAGIITKLMPIPPLLLRAVVNFLKERTGRLRVNDAISAPFNIHSGVLQGSVLSPLLFILFCFDLPEPENPNVFQQQYADDTVCWASGPCLYAANNLLQEYLSSLESWMRRWRIKPNPNKTQLIPFRYRHKRTTLTYAVTLWNTVVQPVREATYLGVKFTNTLYWKPDIQKCINAMRKRAALITRLRIRLRGCSERVQFLTYTMFVRPLADFRAMCYASARTNLITPILQMERRFLRKFKGLNWQHPSRDVHQSAGIPAITDRMHQLQARYTRRRIDK
ncbi:hypothetical protein CBL_05139 [Carabus blaptoides fortunei]